MSMINQMDEPISEEIIYEPHQLTLEEKNQMFLSLLYQLDLELVRTNATKHGNTELVIRAKS